MTTLLIYKWSSVGTARRLHPITKRFNLASDGRNGECALARCASFLEVIDTVGDVSTDQMEMLGALRKADQKVSIA